MQVFLPNIFKMEVTVIKGATIVHPWGRQVADIEIRAGIIAAIGEINQIGDCQVIDATGMYVFAGAIDPHVHLYLKTPAGYSADDFESGSKAALAGGTTTIIDFVTPQKGQSLVKALENRIKESQSCLTDYMFHVSPVEWRKSTAGEMKTCMHDFGIKSFKIYMAYLSTIGIADDVILKVLNTVAENGGIVAVHCENGYMIDDLSEKYAVIQKSDPGSHARSRPEITEYEAVNRIIAYSQITGCKLYLVHISSAKSVELIRQAKLNRIQVIAETCPHYLLIDECVYQFGGYESAKFVISPPLRNVINKEKLWSAIANDTISTIGTDHCPFHFSTQKSFGFDDFRKIPNGAGGIEHRLELLYTYGVLENNISLEKLVEITSANPAKIFGIYHRKGSIEIGKDADLVIWNPDSSRIIEAVSQFSKCDYSLYEGFNVTGNVEYTIKGGKIVYSVKNGFNNLGKGCLLKPQ